jgi:CBS domain-containing protein
MRPRIDQTPNGSQSADAATVDDQPTRRGDLRDIPVATVMSSPVLAVPATALFDDVLRTLVANGVRHLAVVDEAGRCVGLLADRAVAAEWVGRPMAFGRHVVADACSEIQPMVARDATLVVAARIMRHCGTDAVVVVDNDRRPVGVLTGSDVIALLAKPDPEANGHSHQG